MTLGVEKCSSSLVCSLAGLIIKLIYDKLTGETKFICMGVPWKYETPQHSGNWSLYTILSQG